MKLKRLLAALLVLCMVMPWIPADAAAVEWSIPSVGKMIDRDSYVNPFYEGTIEGRGPENQPTDDSIPEPDVYYTDIEAAAVYMREQMVARQGQFVVGFEDDVKSESLMRDIYKAAVAHTQVPDEGDYLRWNTMKWKATRYTIYDGTCYSMVIVYEVDYYTTAEQELEVDAAVDALLNTLDLGMASDYQKICGAYDWICQNVVYDYENLEDDNYTLKQSSYAALINGTSVCQGYASLLYRLLMELDVDCRVIVGDAGGGHAWNIVELEGLYYNADSTWDASYAQAGWDYNYFLVSEAEFTDHVRDDEYLTAEFLAAYPMGDAPYEPEITSGPWGDNLTWSFADGVLTISGEGEMAKANDRSYYPWYPFVDRISQVIIKPGITDVKRFAFYGYPNLEKVVLGEGVTTLGDLAFSDCPKLKDVIMPSTLKAIETGCFSWSGVETIELPEGLETIGDEAFLCSALTAISIPDTVTRVGSMVFSECSDLVYAKLSGSCQIMREVFMGCVNLETVIIPEGVEQLGTDMFSGCAKLNNVILPDSLTYLGLSCFSNCTSLSNIVIPENVTYFGSGAFESCSSLATIRFDGNAPEFALGAFGYLTVTVYYPAGNETWTEAVMQQHGNLLTWVAYDAVGTCDNDLTWVLADGVLTITGTGEMLAYPAPWEAYREQITKAVIETGVTNVGDSAFRECVNLEEVVIPEGVTYIAPEAFYGCTSLKSVKLPEGVKDICGLAFANCTSLTAVTLPEGLECLWSHAFNGCTSLEEITIPASVNDIWLGAFANCSNLKKITFKGNAPFFDPEVFYGVTATAYYPAGDDTWTPEAMTHYGANITWIPVFPDVPEDEYYYEPVMWAVEHGITTGTGDGSTFSPERACTRAQVVTFLWRAAGCPEPQSMSHSFTDVKAGSYYEKAVIWAVENGITSGKGSSTTFQPDTTCNRAEVVTFLWRAKGKPTPESSSNPFPDVPAGSYYEQAVLWAVENEITTGKGNGNFAPTESCTRAHVVTFLYRAFAEA